MKQLRKLAAAEITYRTGLHRLVNLRYGGNGVVLALHSVVENHEEHLMGNHCPAFLLDNIINNLSRWGYRFLGIDAAFEHLRMGTRDRFAVFTFDDGFKDNLTIVPRILEKYSAPFTVYVTTEMVTRELDAWWLGLQDLLKKCDVVDIEPLGIKYDCDSREKKIAVLNEVFSWVHADYGRATEITTYLRNQGVVTTDILEIMALSRDDVTALARHPLACIGGHTTSHPALKCLAATDAQTEIEENKAFLEALIQDEVSHFAYPYGDERACDDREAAIVEQLGFRSAVTTRHGTIFPEHLHHRYAIPRIGVHPTDTTATIANKVAGVYRFAKSGGGTPVVKM